MRRSNGMRWRARGGLVISVVMAAALAGCQNPFNPVSEALLEEATGEAFEPTTPQRVLDNLVVSYQEMDIDRYMACFDSTDFTFKFDPSEPGLEALLDGLGIVNNEWYRTEEWLATQALFADVRRLGGSISVALTGGPPHPWSGDPSGNTVEIQRAYQIEVRPIQTDVVGTAFFRLRTNEHGNWVIVEWQDKMREEP
jgi:hypothetical protein